MSPTFRLFVSLGVVLVTAGCGSLRSRLAGTWTFQSGTCNSASSGSAFLKFTSTAFTSGQVAFADDVATYTYTVSGCTLTFQNRVSYSDNESSVTLSGQGTYSCTGTCNPTYFTSCSASNTAAAADYTVTMVNGNGMRLDQTGGLTDRGLNAACVANGQSAPGALTSTK